jgi:acylphosphatase
MKKSAVKLRIRGFVQGVFFRASTKETADSLGLNGWVRNLPDGSVEAFFEGDDDKVKDAVKWCRSGPPGARVSEVNEEWVQYCKETDSFEIRYGY